MCITYYRLKITDELGTVSYSQIIALVNGIEETVLASIMPSLINNTATISIRSVVNTRIDLFVIDMQGRIIKKQVHQVLKGDNSTSISCEGLLGGSYILLGQTDLGKTNAIRFIKQ